MDLFLIFHLKNIPFICFLIKKKQILTFILKYDTIYAG